MRKAAAEMRMVLCMAMNVFSMSFVKESVQDQDER
jgi:hypothetical protein